jgi:histone H3/H4
LGGEFPSLPFARILKAAGARRVSDSAAEELAKVLEEKISKLAEEAVALANHAGRKTILDEDVRMARRKLNI